MKDRIILNKENVIAFRPKGLDVYSQKYVEEIDVIENTKEIEQVPENWGDFLELCKTLKKVFIPANEYYVEFNKLRFYMDGTVEFNGVIIKIVVGVSRMWQIIKNLMGK